MYSIAKKLEPTGDLCITFTDEEMQKLGISEKDKFSVELLEDGSISLKKFASMSLDMSDWERELLEHIIKESCETDKSVNEVISTILEEKIQALELEAEVDKYDLIQYT
jgi:hypothetical protein